MSVVMVLGGQKYQHVPVIRKARELGLTVVCIDPGNVEGIAIADHGYQIDIGDFAACLEVARAHDVAGVLTTATEFPVETVAYITEAMGLAGISRATARNVRDKYWMRRELERSGIPIPWYRLCHTLQEVRTLMEESGPVVIKPLRESGSRGVTAVELPHDLEAGLRRAGTPPFVVEEKIDGDEVSLEGIVDRDGHPHLLAVTDKHTTGEPWFVEIGHCQPGRFSGPWDGLFRKTVAGLGLRNTAIHLEAKGSPPRIMEIAARTGGGFIGNRLTTLSTGIDYLRAVIQVSLGEKPNLNPVAMPQPVAIRFLSSDNAGIVKRMRGIAEARAIGTEVEVWVSPGDRVEKLTEGNHRVGYVLAHDDTPESANHRARQAAKRISIDI